MGQGQEERAEKATCLLLQMVDGFFAKYTFNDRMAPKLERTLEKAAEHAPRLSMFFIRRTTTNASYKSFTRIIATVMH